MNSLLTLPYPERRIALVLNAYDAETVGRHLATAWGGNADWNLVRKLLPPELARELLDNSKDSYLLLFHPRDIDPRPRVWLRNSAKLFSSVMLCEISKRINRFHADPRERALGIIRIETQEARTTFEFSPGHAQPGKFYAGHPVVPQRYIPLESLPRVLFEEKVNELITLLASLGATYVKAHCIEGYNFISHASGTAMTPKGTVSGRLDEAAFRASTASFEEHYIPKNAPSIPSGLVWCDHEPTWQALARRRLDFGAISFKTQLTHTQDYGIRTEIKAGIFGGLKAGKSVYQSTIWEFEGQFVPLPP